MWRGRLRPVSVGGGIVVAVLNVVRGRGANWASGGLFVATLGTLVIARIRLPVFFGNAARGDGAALAGVIILLTMPLLAGVLGRVAYWKPPRRWWWIAFGALALCWVCVAFLTLFGMALEDLAVP